jgi:molybdopterin-guanine dinucleotide biosynthesis adapter protein
MARCSQPVVVVVGRSNTGKTTLIERILPVLSAKGLRIAVVKHRSHGGFDVDTPGKDTYRYKEAGAATAIISGLGRVALVTDVEGELPLAEIICRYAHHADLIIAEGYKAAALPKIEVFREKSRGDAPVCLHDPNLVALVTEEKITTHVPIFSPHDALGVADFILARFCENVKWQNDDR